MDKDEMLIVCFTGLLAMLIFFGAILLSEINSNACRELLKDKPSAEIGMVCK